MTYGTETGFHHVLAFASDNKGECVLQEGEFIQEVHMSYSIFFFIHTVLGGLKFVTSNNQTCGPFGRTDMSDSDVVTGDHLLYIEGEAGPDVYDKLIFVFETCGYFTWCHNCFIAKTFKT